MKWLEHGRAASLCDQQSCDDDHHGPVDTEVSYLHFLHMVEQAEADAVVLAVGHLSKAMSRDWRAALAWLDRRHSSEFKPQERVELTGAQGGPVRVEDAREKLMKKIEAIAERIRSAETTGGAP